MAMPCREDGAYVHPEDSLSESCANLLRLIDIARTERARRVYWRQYYAMTRRFPKEPTVQNLRFLPRPRRANAARRAPEDSEVGAETVRAVQIKTPGGEASCWE